jgi:hypothetical protein
MAAVPHPSLFVSAGVGALVLWRAFSRVRRMIGRQQLTTVRPWITVIVFPLLFTLLMFSSRAHAMNVLALAVGAAVGAALGLYGLRLTKFEQTAEGLYYTPSAHLGIALSLLFFGRLAYRIFQMYLPAEHAPAVGLNDPSGSPLTLAIFAMLAAYYVTYAVGLLRWRKRAEGNQLSTDPV